MVAKNRWCLWTDEGKIVTIREFMDEKRMCAVEYHEEDILDHQVLVRERERKETRQMAFHFCFGGSFYCPIWDGKNLKICKVDEISDLSENQWFGLESQENGNYYSLSTPEDPRYYLSVLYHRPYTFLLSDSPQDCVFIIVKKL